MHQWREQQIILVQTLTGLDYGNKETPSLLGSEYY